MLKIFLIYLILGVFFEIALSQNSVPPPIPILPIPTERQLVWQETELAMFLHFGVNTFTNREWGTGKEEPNIFNPIHLDTRQWARVAKESGFGKLILTAKHHDGFCLWPSQYTEHSVKNSPWKNGQGDIVAELRQACDEFGLQMGLYLSPWDRHEPTYGDTRLYNLYYMAQLRELLTNYGDLFEIWFDGAKGKDAKDMLYNFEAYWSLVRQLQPKACLFSDQGPDVRWIGNEHGFAGESCWSFINRSAVNIGKADTNYLNSGDEDGADWVAGECDVSIRKGWFWHKDQEPKSLEQLLDIYFKSVGRNGILLLNVPPNNQGLLPESDVEGLYEFKKALDSIFWKNLALYKKVIPKHFRGNAPEFNGSKIVDGNTQTFWAEEDGIFNSWLEIDLGTEVTFNLSEIREPIFMGQRIQQYRLEGWIGEQWQTIVTGTTIGNKKIDQFKKVKTNKVKLIIEKSRVCPLVAEFGLYLNPFH
jgi:alpha-L-fucosidase